MRVLLATLGSRGDVEPFLWLARALQEDGHTVRVLGPDEVDQGTDDLDIASLLKLVTVPVVAERLGVPALGPHPEWAILARG